MPIMPIKPIDLPKLLELVGDLRDSTDPGSASGRFRKYVRENVRRIEDVRAYVDKALSTPGSQFNKALQDLVNHIGELLGFEVTWGRYRGVKGDIGFDGLWQSPTNWSIVVETKTTDVYTIKTATLLGYINSLISDHRVSDPTKVLGLYVYGRRDAQTSQLENAIIGERRRELRVISVESLLNLLELKQEYNLAHDTVLGLILPTPVKIDPLIDLIFDIVAREREESTFGETPGKKPGASLIRIDEKYTGKTVKAMIFRGKRYELSTWKEATATLLDVLRRDDREKFERVAVTIVNQRKRPYISRDASKLRKPEAIKGTSLYFETNLSAQTLVRLCYTLIVEMGYSKSALQFETEA